MSLFIAKCFTIGRHFVVCLGNCDSTKMMEESNKNKEEWTKKTTNKTMVFIRRGSHIKPKRSWRAKSSTNAYYEIICLNYFVFFSLLHACVCVRFVFSFIRDSSVRLCFVNCYYHTVGALLLTLLLARWNAVGLAH